MADTLTNPDDRDLLAAELALGLLEGEGLAAALRMRLSDPEFAGMVDAWEIRLAPLFDQFPSEIPSDAVWEGIDSRLSDRATGDGTVAEMPATGGPGLWRVAALASGAVAAVLAFFLIAEPGTQQLSPPVTPDTQVAAAQIFAQLSGDNEDLSITARFEPQDDRLTIRSQGVESGTSAPVLWVIPADGTPRSLGIIPENETGAVEIDPRLGTFIEEGATLALTLEDPASAPFDTPTAPILATGTVTKL